MGTYVYAECSWSTHISFDVVILRSTNTDINDENEKIITNSTENCTQNKTDSKIVQYEKMATPLTDTLKLFSRDLKQIRTYFNSNTADRIVRGNKIVN